MGCHYVAEAILALASTDALAAHDEELLRPIRELVEKWPKPIQNKLAEGVAYDSARLQCAIELEAALPGSRLDD